ncbi:HIT-type domain-containing protein [Balamuthia mandrillaris]
MKRSSRGSKRKDDDAAYQPKEKLPSSVGSTPNKRRQSGRLRVQSQRIKERDPILLRQQKLEERLESLEHDNYAAEEPVETADVAPAPIIEETEELEATYTPKKKKKKTTQRDVQRQMRLVKNFNKVLENAGYENYPPHVPTYFTIAAAPSRFPPRHFCSVCGYLSSYTCTRCGLRYCCIKCKGIHEENRCLKFTV